MPTTTRLGQVISPDWADAIDQFLIHLTAGGAPKSTITARRQQLQHLARRVASGPWELTSDELLAYVTAQTWARETRRGRRSAFRTFYAWGRKRGHVRRNVAKCLPQVKPDEGEPRPVPVPIYERAMRRADDRTRLILRMAKEAGMRRAEIAVSNSDDLMPDLVGWSLLVHGKGGKRRVVPLSPRLALELRVLAESDPGYFFKGAIDGHLSPRRVSELAVEALDAPWTLHKLRARFATDTLKSSGGNTLLVQKLMGHANANTTGRYALVDADDARRAVDIAARSVKPTLTPESTAWEAVG